MINYQISKKDEIKNIREAFNELSWEQELRWLKDTGENESSISLSDIYNYIKTAPGFDENIENPPSINVNNFVWDS